MIAEKHGINSDELIETFFCLLGKIEFFILVTLNHPPMKATSSLSK
jgi:hypothetical protein